MTETAARRQPESTVAVRREVLTQDLETKAASLAALRKEMQVATGADIHRSRLLNAFLYKLFLEWIPTFLRQRRFVAVFCDQ